MSSRVENISSPALARAIEANSAEEVVGFARALPGGEEHEDAELHWFYTGRPYNGVVRTHLARSNSDYVATRIEEVIGYFKPREVVFNWAVGPTTQPSDLPIYLEAHGFVQRAEDRWMSLDTELARQDIPAPAHLFIKEIMTLAELRQHFMLEMKAFGASEQFAQFYYDTYARLGFGEGKSWHHYLGLLHDEPVAIASLLLHAGVAGIYGIATLPQTRRQGIGAAMTLHAVREAHRLSYRVAILSPSDMGMGMYRRIGFQDYCTIQHYLWWPT